MTHPIGAQTPEMNPNIWNIVSSCPLGDPPHVDRMRNGIERAFQSFQFFPVAQVWRVLRFRPSMIHMLRPAQPLKNTRPLALANR
jgi:hypothetical protein